MSGDTRLVLVRWKDAHADGTTWTSLEEIEKAPYIVTTVGIHLEEVKPDHITVVQSRGQDGALDHILHIPGGMVLEIVPLKAKKVEVKL